MAGYTEVIVTGFTWDWPGYYFVRRLHGVVGRGTWFCDHDQLFKVWPCDGSHPDLPPDHDGKIWFDGADPFTEIEIVDSEFVGLKGWNLTTTLASRP